jgi:hypothetical protein
MLLISVSGSVVESSLLTALSSFPPLTLLSLPVCILLQTVLPL